MLQPRYLIAKLLLFVAILVIAGCAPAAPFEPTPDPLTVEQTVAAIKTHAAETVIAELTASAPLPTETAIPSPTSPPPTEEPTPLPPTATATRAPIVFPTATFIPLPTHTPTPSALACAVVSLSPASGATYKVRDPFDLNVVVRNTGTDNWDEHQVDFFYVSGTKMQTFVDRIDMPAHVPSGGEIRLIIDMTAPATAGNYTTSWAVGQGGTRFCTVTINIKVTE
jgi:hypothetical protein